MPTCPNKGCRGLPAGGLGVSPNLFLSSYGELENEACSYEQAPTSQIGHFPGEAIRTAGPNFATPLARHGPGLQPACAGALRLRQGRVGRELVSRDRYHDNSQLRPPRLIFEPALGPGMNFA